MLELFWDFRVDLDMNCFFMENYLEIFKNLDKILVFGEGFDYVILWNLG